MKKGDGVLKLIKSRLRLIRPAPMQDVNRLLLTSECTCEGSKLAYSMNKGGKCLKKLWCCVGGSIAR